MLLSALPEPSNRVGRADEDGERIEEPTAANRGTPVNSDATVSETTNVWPDEAAEAAFLAEAGGNALPIPPTSAPATVALGAEDEVVKSLPKLDELVERIPAETRELLEELFRAKFTTVRRVKKTDLKVS